ncbi:hypothetical protein E1B28_001271 [Marasmius oreades]|uniref:Uncharacterized protein n=1 Tax=Marasmius oreades TaxID=181124 RepID=A0A9P8AF90_9AGAR|nr:uncharacterized protein E1B28_001271 [Marasmius oreades]KAG7099419.1 hypothetical protein E1B28_001271 [Marasmius oreades]
MFLFQILFLVYYTLVVADVQHRTISFSDSLLQFSSGWLATHEQLSGNIFFTFNEASVVALKGTLPNSTQRFEYIGLRRVGGSQYGVCLNCDEDDSSILLVDGHDGSLQSDEQSTLTIIFSLEVERDRQNTFVLFNLPDDRFDGRSSITFQSLVVTIDGDIDGTPESVSSSSGIQTSSSTISTTSTRPSSASQISVTQVTAGNAPSSSSETTVSTPTGGMRGSIVAIIVVFTVLPVGSLLVGFYFYMRHCKARRKSRSSDFFTYNPNPVGRRFPSFRASRIVYAPTTA